MLSYKGIYHGILSSRVNQITSNYVSDDEYQDDDIDELLIKLDQLYRTKDPYEVLSIIDTIANEIGENHEIANSLIENDFNSVFSFLMNFDTDIFYCSLFNLLSVIFKYYMGDIREFITEDMLNFLNYLFDTDCYTFISNLECVICLLTADKMFTRFFIENGLYNSLINYQFLQKPSENKIKAIFNTISLLLQDDENNLTIEDQSHILDLIFQSLKITNKPSDGEISILTCLDIFTRASFLQNQSSETNEFLIFDEEKRTQIKDEIMGSIKLNNEYIVSICLDIINVFIGIVDQSDLFLEENNLEELQKQINIILSIFPNSTQTVLNAFKTLTEIADNVKYNELISDESIESVIKFYDCDIFSIKSKLALFLAVLIQMVSDQRVCSIIEAFPNITEILCDFLHTKDVIFDRIINALTSILDLSLNNLIQITPIEIFQLVDIDFLREYQLNLENCNDDNSLNCIILSSIRVFLNRYDVFEEEEENE